MNKVIPSDCWELDWDAMKSNLANVIMLSYFDLATIAECLCTSKRNVENWVHGDAFPAIENLAALATMLDYPMENFIITKYQTKEILYGIETCKDELELLMEEQLNDDRSASELIYSVLSRMHSEPMIRSINDLLMILFMIPERLLHEIIDRGEDMGANETNYTKKLLHKIEKEINNNMTYEKQMELYRSRYPWMNKVPVDEAWTGDNRKKPIKHVDQNDIIKKSLDNYRELQFDQMKNP
mgnify:CR=1 FL=1